MRRGRSFIGHCDAVWSKPVQESVCVGLLHAWARGWPMRWCARCTYGNTGVSIDLQRKWMCEGAAGGAERSAANVPEKPPGTNTLPPGDQVRTLTPSDPTRLCQLSLPDSSATSCCTGRRRASRSPEVMPAGDAAYMLCHVRTCHRAPLYVW